jgi:hypothetical protein
MPHGEVSHAPGPAQNAEGRIVGPPFEGVDTFLSVHGIAVRTLVPRRVLQTRLCAGESPESWVECFIAHGDAIHRATVRRFNARPSNPIVIEETDL